MKEVVHYRPIGIVYSPFKKPVNMPVQPAGAEGIEGRVELRPDFEEGLPDLAGFSHVSLIYHLHLTKGFKLRVTPFLDDHPRGIFATRSPNRPNPIGLSVVRLLSIEGCTLRVSDIDIVDGTPLLDIKPYIPEFESMGGVRIGWLEQQRHRIRTRRSDNRFLYGQNELWATQDSTSD